ncbi:hypothetical protein K504DRAFT_112852 [Pleomassaria siparia CBS 279.74]|uniref:Uncharacterized protein n=1 Tax=Pleomassaria siparia CBS 279.74 TaxID=1314801 RepID=A0A6G1JW29_9PLEO|nr:hypothetical protein K504DRAFT_112852 [Pleomassaria siparia CBS 279.74]
MYIQRREREDTVCSSSRVPSMPCYSEQDGCNGAPAIVPSKSHRATPASFASSIFLACEKGRTGILYGSTSGRSIQGFCFVSFLQSKFGPLAPWPLLFLHVETRVFTTTISWRRSPSAIIHVTGSHAERPSQTSTNPVGGKYECRSPSSNRSAIWRCRYGKVAI